MQIYIDVFTCWSAAGIEIRQYHDPREAATAILSAMKDRDCTYISIAVYTRENVGVGWIFDFQFVCKVL